MIVKVLAAVVQWRTLFRSVVTPVRPVTGNVGSNPAGRLQKGVLTNDTADV